MEAWVKIFKCRWTPIKLLRIISQLLETSFLGKVNLSPVSPTLQHRDFLSWDQENTTLEGAFLAQKTRIRKGAGLKPVPRIR